MSARYFTTERIFVATGPRWNGEVPVYSCVDLSPSECEMLADSVQRELKATNTEQFLLGPSSQVDPPTFITLKSAWARRRNQIELNGEAGTDLGLAALRRINRIAAGHAEIIREIRSLKCPTAYLQCQEGDDDFESFGRVDSLVSEELKLLRSVLESEVNAMGLGFRMIVEEDAETDRSALIKVRLRWSLQSRITSCTSKKHCEKAAAIARECISQIEATRFQPSCDAKWNACIARVIRQLNSGSAAAPAEFVEASEKLREQFSDPDNYWRNVWLYRLKQDGKKNAQILTSLKAESQYQILETENALRNAIDSIAVHHGWPRLKGKAGRPCVNSSEKMPQRVLNTPQ